MNAFQRMEQALERVHFTGPTTPVKFEGVVYDLELATRAQVQAFERQLASPVPWLPREGQAARPLAKLRAIDLFAGLGGFSMGAEMAGLETVWAANHCVQAVLFYQMNHPTVANPACQNVLTIQPHEWQDLVPPHDVMLASPSCVPFSRSSAGRQAKLVDGKDPLRQTPLAAVRAASILRPRYFFMENVPEFAQNRENRKLYRKCRAVLERAGYVLSETIINAADLGTAINRVRWFLTGHLEGPPMRIPKPNKRPKPVSSIVDWSMTWKPLSQTRVRSESTYGQVAAGMKLHRRGAPGYNRGFIVPYWGTDRKRAATHGLNRPLGSFRKRGSNGIVKVVNGKPWWRMLSVKERLAAMGFPARTKLVDEVGYLVQMGYQFTGNAVAPPQGCWVVQEGLRSVGAL